MPASRRRISVFIALVAALAVTACSATNAQPAPELADSRESAAGSAEAEALEQLIQDFAADAPVRAVIAELRRGDRTIASIAMGESMPGVDATPNMHVRNGAMAIPEVTTVLLQLVDEGAVSLDDTVDEWLPDVPNAERVTLGQLANMTAGYADFVSSDAFLEAYNAAGPFAEWEPEELQAFGTEQPLIYEPGTNWNYSHTDVVLLGLALEKITRLPLADLIRQRILSPLGLEDTSAPGNPTIPEPVLHSYTPERLRGLGVRDQSAVEDATFWNPSWTLARGAVQVSTAQDMATLYRAIGRGDLLSKESHALQLAPTLRGKTTAIDGCTSCFEQSRAYTFGYGVVLTGDWVVQNPLFAGLGGVAGYLPEEDLTLVVFASLENDAYDEQGNTTGNPAQDLFTAIANELAPGTAVSAP